MRSLNATRMSLQDYFSRYLARSESTGSWRSGAELELAARCDYFHVAELFVSGFGKVCVAIGWVDGMYLHDSWGGHSKLPDFELRPTHCAVNTFKP